MAHDNTTPLLRSLLLLLDAAEQHGEQEAIDRVSAEVRREEERIAARVAAGESIMPPPDPAYLVQLYEDESGTLYLVGPDRRQGLTYVVSNDDDAEFAYDAEAMLGGDTAGWAIPSLPTPLLDLDALTLIASYDGAEGAVIVERDADGECIATGRAGRRYIGYPDE